MDGEGAIGAPLQARGLQAEGAPHLLRGGAGSHQARAAQGARQGRLTELGVWATLVLLLDPGLRRFVEQGQGEFALAFEHGEEPSFDLAPKALLLRVLLGRTGQRGLMDDAQAFQSLGGLVGDHGRAVVGHQRPRPAPFGQGLTQAVDEVLSRLRQIPLQVTTQAGVIIEDTQQHGLVPLPVCGQHFTGAFVKVQVPQLVDVADFVGALLERGPGHDRKACGAVPHARPLPFLAQQTLVPHEAAHRWVRGHRMQGRVFVGQRHQVVVMELVAPAGVLLILGLDGLHKPAGHGGMRARLSWHLALQRREGIHYVLGPVVPALDRGGAEADPLFGRRMLVVLRGQLPQPLGELAGFGWCGQQGTDDGEAQPCPAHAHRRGIVVAHGKPRKMAALERAPC